MAGRRIEIMFTDDEPKGRMNEQPETARVEPIVLLPCPFCGSDASYMTFQHDHGIDHIADCNDCPARIETGRRETTLAAWNTRT